MDINEIREVLGNEFAYIYNEIIPVIQDLNLKNDAKILDVGTGMGRMAITLALNNYKVTTGEPESDESQYAKQDWLESAKKAGIDHLITYTPFNAEEMLFEDAFFDIVFILGALHHIGNKKAALKESSRVIKSNGIICIFEPNSNGIRMIREGKFPTHPDAIDPRDYTQELNLSWELIERPFYDTYLLKKQTEF